MAIENLDRIMALGKSLDDMRKRRQEADRRQREEERNDPDSHKKAIRKAQERIHESRLTWGPGPWKKEPDRKEFRAHGFDCMIIRAPLGNLCGYVGLPPEHPFYGKAYNEEGFPDLDVHGGITYSDHCIGHICHTPRPGEPDSVFWLGFDCAHGGDFLPSETSIMQQMIRKLVAEDMKKIYGPDYNSKIEHERLWGRKTYKVFNWVEMETKRLARQLRKLAESPTP